MRISDWSADVCSSDLIFERGPRRRFERLGDRLRRHVAGAADEQHLIGVRSLDGIADLGMTKHRTHLEQHPQGDRAARIAGTMPFGHRRGCIERELAVGDQRSEEHTSELQSLMRISYAVFCLKKKKNKVQ